MRNLLAKVLLLSALIVAAPQLAVAQTGLTIQPVKVSQTLNPGQEATGSILLSNASEEDVLIELKVEDFIPLAGSDSIQFVGRAEGVSTVRDWITVADGEPSFTLKKGEQRSVPYRIVAPVGAEPGSHFGVAFFKATKLSEDQSQLRVGTQVGVLVFVTVPGNFLQRGEIDSFIVPTFLQDGPVPLDLVFRNTGTVHFEPKGTVTIRNLFGSIVGTVPIEGQVVLPSGVKTLRYSWNPEGFLLGRYTASAVIKDPEGNTLTAESAAFYAAPLWYLLLFFIVLVLAYIVIRFLKTRVRISINLAPKSPARTPGPEGIPENE